MKTRCFVENYLFIVLVMVKCILLHYTKFPPKLLVCHKFLKEDIAAKDIQQNHKKLGQKHNQKSGTGLSQTDPVFFLDCCRQRQFYLDSFYFLDQPSVL